MRAQTARPQTLTTSLPPPIGGWNARDSIADMPATDARFLENWFPSTSDIVLRNGFSEWATGLPDLVETLAHYAGGGTDKLFAWSDDSVFDVTSGGAVGAAVVTALTNARWEFENVATAGGNFLLAVNGTDKLLNYDGTTWTKVDGVSAHAITGVTTTTLSNIALWKTRVFFLVNNSLNFYYLGTGAISGAATAFSLQGIANLGGYLVDIGTWTIDAGQGVNDFLVFVTNKGQVIIYQGTDPASATTFSLLGVYNCGAPIGRRCLFKYIGDMLLISEDGVVPLSALVQSTRVNPKVTLTDKIQQATSSAVSLYGANFGWQLLYFANMNQLYLNVPVATGQQQQYVMNTITKSWCNFTGWAASCWELFQDEPYFGADGVVCKAWDTLADNGDNINGDAGQAFNYFGARGQQKRWTLTRPFIQANGTPAVLAGIDVDFEEQMLTPISTGGAIPISAWDTAIWDVDIWGGGLNIYKYWQGVNGMGFCGSLRMQAASRGIETRWLGTDVVMEKGGVL
jgi:hypothetical protein